MKKTNILVLMSLLISLEIILTRFLAIQTPIVRIGFGFLPIAFSSILFGPIIGGITAALADILGMIIAPKGPYFPGFTISALITGIVYGIFLFQKPKSSTRISLASCIIILFINIGLNTLWVSILTGNPFFAVLPPRIIKELAMFPIQVVVIYTAWKYTGTYIEMHYLNAAKKKYSP